jgi:hypothetical protein
MVGERRTQARSLVWFLPEIDVYDRSSCGD